MSWASTGLIGNQLPTVEWYPESYSSAGYETIQLAKKAGLVLDPWQCHVLDKALGEDENNKWTSFEAAVIVSRQNGKGAILEARELAGLFLFDEQLILHSAHEFKTARESFKRVRSLIENTPVLIKKVKAIRVGTHEQVIELKSGQRLLFVARSSGSGRGFSGDCVILDEAYNLPDAMINALMPTMSARPNPQLWYTTSAPDIDIAPCEQIGNVRKRAIEGGDPSLAYFEWSAEVHDEDCLPECEEHDEDDNEDVWKKANPALGIRVSLEHIRREKRSMTKAGFQRERLGVGNYPADTEQWRVVSEKQWKRTEDIESSITPTSSVVYAVDVSPDGLYGTIAVCGLRHDGVKFTQLVAHLPGTAWIQNKLVELNKKRKSAATIILPTSQAGTLLSRLELIGLEITTPSSLEYAQACGQFYNEIKQLELFHPHQRELDLAVAAAIKKEHGTQGVWTWARKGVSVIISPLIVATLASWGHTKFGHKKAVTPWISWDD